MGEIPMLPSRSNRARLMLRSGFGLAGLAGLVGAVVLPIGPAAAQSSVCQEVGAHLTERRSLVDAIEKLSGKNKKMDAKAACAAFGKLVTNGNVTIKSVELNKDWCQIPGQLIETIKADHEKIVKIRGQACGAAAKQAEMEKKAREGQASGLLGGDGLEGSYKIPKGAL
jgi:hypothetical protein